MTRTPQKVAFIGSLGTALDGRLDLPAGPARAFALFAHCFTCSKDVVAAGRIAAELNCHGIGVLRFNQFATTKVATITLSADTVTCIAS